jgi:flagellar L-ring protein precursor FlgH
MRIFVYLLFSAALLGAEHQKRRAPLDEYIDDATSRAWAHDGVRSPGSTYTDGGMLANPARDLRASQIDDLVTILVQDRATASSKGSTDSSRASSAQFGVDAAYGSLNGGRWSNLAGANGQYSVQGQGTTSRENAFTTQLTARVTHVLPNGNLVIQGVKEIGTNSEKQLVIVRGIVRPVDITGGNFVRSERVSDLQIAINGKGVVGDAIRRPNFLYRLLMGVLPF